MNWMRERCDGSGAALGSCNCVLMIHKHGREQSCPISSINAATPLLTRAEYANYGKTYRDYIYANLCNNIPAGYSPFFACSFYFYVMALSDDDHAEAYWQNFGLEYICILGDEVFYTSATIDIRHILWYKDAANYLVACT